MAPKTEIVATESIREISPNIPPSSGFTTIQVGLAIVPIAFVVTLAFIFFKQVKYRKNLYSQVVASKRFSSIPCHKCQFFDNNQYLPCSVQPILVLSEEAFNCSDYRAIKT